MTTHKKCPCKDCTKRWVNGASRCHASCKEYKEWSEQQRAEKAAQAKFKKDNDRIGDVLFKSLLKRQR